MFRIIEPCSRRWADFPGDGRRRFCGECGKFVHDVAGYSEAELRALGPVCGYVGGETWGAPQSRRAVIAGVVLTTISPLLAQDGRVRVVVTDAAGTPVKHADVTIGDRRLKADDQGVASAVGLPVGRVEITVSTMGFKTWKVVHTVSNGGELKVDARLELGEVGGGRAYVEPVKAGSLWVRVLDPTMSAVVTAEVTIRFSGAMPRTVRVDGNGSVSLPSLPPGKVEVEVRAPGFKDWRGSTKMTGANEVIEARMEISDPGTRIAVKPSVGRRFVDWLTSCTRR